MSKVVDDTRAGTLQGLGASRWNGQEVRYWPVDSDAANMGKRRHTSNAKRTALTETKRGAQDSGAVVDVMGGDMYQEVAKVVRDINIKILQGQAHVHSAGGVVVHTDAVSACDGIPPYTGYGADKR